MKSNRVRLRNNPPFPNQAPEPDLEALEIARARQDVSHQKLHQWITAAIAELSDRERAA